MCRTVDEREWLIVSFWKSSTGPSSGSGTSVSIPGPGRDRCPGSDRRAWTERNGTDGIRLVHRWKRTINGSILIFNVLKSNYHCQHVNLENKGRTQLSVALISCEGGAPRRSVGPPFDWPTFRRSRGRRHRYKTTARTHPLRPPRGADAERPRERRTQSGTGEEVRLPRVVLIDLAERRGVCLPRSRPAVFGVRTGRVPA